MVYFKYRARNTLSRRIFVYFRCYFTRKFRFQKNAEPTPENADHSKDSNNSEYETVDESGDEADDRVGKRRAGDSASGSETEGSITLEREEGDGQESAPAKKVDDDEDKKNPQYIPKRGTFYEHDDRTVDET